MNFVSASFIAFFSLFFFFYWFVFNKDLKLQNLLLLISSYIFYAWADMRLLSYLVGASALNFLLGIYIEKYANLKYKKWLLFAGLLQGIGGLIFFKYYNFFIESFNSAFHSLSIYLNLQTLQIIVPLGISFFTFRMLSYLLDIDKGKIKPTKDWIIFFNYVSFFPTLLSGPIDKARDFIPQLGKKRIFNDTEASDGLRQILWGLFKKVVIADNCAILTNHIFDNFNSLNGSTLLLGAFLYTIQLYADFSGYSDMAIGLSRLVGFTVTKNFAFPLFAQNIAEFWRRWHISLTSWLTEYVFTPLSIAFRDFDKMGIAMAIIVNFTLIGIWHGANWTFVLFGFIHGCLFIPLIINGTMNKRKKTSKNKLLPSGREVINMLGTITIVTLTFIIFRANNFSYAMQYLSIIFSFSLFQHPQGAIFLVNNISIFTFALLIFSFIAIEWLGRENKYAIEKINYRLPLAFRWATYYLLIFSIFYFQGDQQQFIYFQF